MKSVLGKLGLEHNRVTHIMFRVPVFGITLAFLTEKAKALTGWFKSSLTLLLLLLFHSLNCNVPFLYPAETVLIKSVVEIKLSKI